MAGFKSTDTVVSPQSGQHKHLVYLDEQAGTGVLSPGPDGHSHEIMYQQAQDEQLDEMGNVIAPAVPGGWQITPGPDGHQHFLQDVAVAIKSKRNKEAAAEVFKEWEECRSLEQESLEDGEKSKEFYTGDQWNDGDKAMLQGQARACLTLNVSGRQIDELSGVERQQRTEFKLLPVESTDQRATDMYQAVVKQIANRAFYSTSKSGAFKDTLVTGRGWINLWVDFSRDILGEIRIERFDNSAVTCGPHEDLMLRDCEILFKEKWYSVDKLKAVFGDKAKDIQANFDSVCGIVPQKHTRHRPGRQYADTDNWKHVGAVFGGHNVIDTIRKQYRVLERWKRVTEKVTLVGYPRGECWVQAHGWSAADIEMARSIPGALVIERPVEKMRITKVAGDVILSDEAPADLPVDDFFIVPVYGYKEGSRFWGKMAQMRELQQGINKMLSLEVDVLNKTSSWAWFYDSSTFPDNMKEYFRENANKPGALFEVNDLGRRPVKEEGTRYPTELTQALELKLRFLQMMGNVTPEAPGANTSAQAILQRQKQMLKGNEELFDNLSVAQQQLGRLLLRTIKRYYTPKRILRILQQANAQQSVMIGDRTFDQWTEQEVIDILEKTDIENYDVVVTESDSSPSAMLGTHLMLADLASKGTPIPPAALIETAVIPEKMKEKLLQQLQAQSESQGQSASATADMEIKKTLIGQGLVPPEVLQQYGLAPAPMGGIGEGEPLPTAPGQPMSPQQGMPPQVPQGMPQMQQAAPAPGQPPMQQMQIPQGQQSTDPMMDMGGAPNMEQMMQSELQAQQGQQMQASLSMMADSIRQLAEILARNQQAPVVNVINQKGGALVGKMVRDPLTNETQFSASEVDTPV